ncbi:helix-turn-helix domain-containing protein [Variovorax sp. H27-G14]|uniref:helix-turn-helix domain-containing protein n=1 Tax=Variovorax sp. H27-G14 TaxID=3111914 RepID=UPI0038FD2991
MVTEYGLRLRAARKFAGLTQAELGKRAGVGGQSTVSTAERLGGGSADTSKYAVACGVDAHWLATGEGQMLPSGHAAAPVTRATAQNSSDLGGALSTIGDAIRAADGETRGDVLKMLELFVSNPSTNAGQLPLILERLSGESVRKRAGNGR